MVGRSLAFFASLSLAISPALAQTAPAPPAPVARAGAQAAGGNALFDDGNWLPPLLFIAIVIGGILMATGVWFDKDNDDPVSP